MELINKQYTLASAISGIVITDENGEKWIRTRDVRESIMNVPIIDVEPVKHGRWIRKDSKRCYWYECSNCGYPPPLDKYKHEWFSEYCPNCGAKMDEVEE